MGIEEGSLAGANMTGCGKGGRVLSKEKAIPKGISSLWILRPNEVETLSARLWWTLCARPDTS